MKTVNCGWVMCKFNVDGACDRTEITLVADSHLTDECGVDVLVCSTFEWGDMGERKSLMKEVKDGKRR